LLTASDRSVVLAAWLNGVAAMAVIQRTNRAGQFTNSVMADAALSIVVAPVKRNR